MPKTVDRFVGDDSTEKMKQPPLGVSGWAESSQHVIWNRTLRLHEERRNETVIDRKLQVPANSFIGDRFPINLLELGDQGEVLGKQRGAGAAVNDGIGRDVEHEVIRVHASDRQSFDNSANGPIPNAN